MHLVGKDILRFHAVIWPAMLLAAGLPLPGKVFAHGWLLVGGEKMSKSKLTAIAPEQITDHFGVDAFRWYFLRAIQFGQDGSFSWEDMGARYTAELANGLGNLVSRVTAMTGRYFDGVLPAAEDVTAAEEAVAAAAAAAVQAADERFLGLDFSEGLAAVGDFVSVLNGYLTEQEPWKVAKLIDSDPAAGRGSARCWPPPPTACASSRSCSTPPCRPLRSGLDMLGAQSAAGRPRCPARPGHRCVGPAACWRRSHQGDALFPRLEEEQST